MNANENTNTATASTNTPAVVNEPASHKAQRDAKAKDAAAKRAKDMERAPTGSNSAHITEAKGEAKKGLALIDAGATQMGLGEQTIAHALITLDASEAFSTAAHFNRWHNRSAKEKTNAIAAMIAFLLGDKPTTPESGRDPQSETAKARYAAHSQAIRRACDLANCLVLVKGKPATKTSVAIDPPVFRPKHGWNVPVVALCAIGCSPFDMSHRITLTGERILIRKIRPGKESAPETDAGKYGVFPVAASVAQLKAATASRYGKAKPEPTAEEKAKAEADAAKGANDTAEARARAATRTFSIAKIAEDPAELTNVFKECVRVWNEQPAATASDNKVANALFDLEAQVVEFMNHIRVLRKRERAKAEGATTPAGKRAMEQGKQGAVA